MSSEGFVIKSRNLTNLRRNHLYRLFFPKQFCRGVLCLLEQVHPQGPGPVVCHIELLFQGQSGEEKIVRIELKCDLDAMMKRVFSLID